jgi:hypothetical protein
MFVIALLVAVFMPVPETPGKEAGATEVTTASEGDIIPVLFGTRDIEGQNVVWYGNIKAVAIRKKGGKK